MRVMDSFISSPFMWTSLFLWVPFLAASSSSHNLIFVNLLFRHGDRTPIDFYPTDPYFKPQEWPVGYGQLTPRGKRMQFELGKYLRQRYNGFISPLYSEKDIFVRSTNVDRTLMSAMSNLAGLYPPKGDQKWNPDLLWQPIPVHTVEIARDSLLSSKAYCPKFKELINETLYENPHFKKLNEKYAGVYSYASKMSGSPITNVINAEYLYDTLMIETIYNKTLPQWTHLIYPNPLEELAAESFKVFTWTHQMKRFRSGLLISKILNNLENAQLPDAKKIIMYSAHDTTIAGLLHSLQIPSITLPTYASCIIMELLKTSDGSTAVRFLYRNDTTREPYNLTLPGCSHLCPLETFKRLTASLRLDENQWGIECQIRATFDIVALISILIGAMFVVIMIIASFYTLSRLCCCPDRKPKYFSINQDPN